jgi:hypothetical protein
MSFPVSNNNSKFEQSNPVYAQAYAVPVEHTAQQAATYDPHYFHSTPAPSAPMTMSAAVPTSASGNESQLRQFLTNHRWPLGLQDTFVRNLQKVPYRFFICDDSGSMITPDGHRPVKAGKLTKFISCSRWQELTQALTFHAEAAKLAGAPTEFRLLNGAAPIVIGTGGSQDGIDDESKFQTLLALFQDSPSGSTPLCQHIREVTARITAMAPTLRAQGQKACVMIATDGESSDGDIAAAMRPLKDLPCWVVVRLCTDEDRIVDYWNNVDSVLELDMDVLDDLQGEAKEVEANNPWLTYGEPIHRIREFGIPIKELDLLDELKLSLDQVVNFAAML